MLQQRWAACKKAVPVVVLIALVMSASVFFRHRPADNYLHSAVPGVDELVDQGNHCLAGKTSERVSRALDYYQRAIKLDPKSVCAYFGLFSVHVTRGGAEWEGPTEARRNLRTVAAELQEIAPSFAESRAASSRVKWLDWQFREALADARLATEMRPASNRGRVAAHIFCGYYLVETGHPDEALKRYRIAEQLDPSSAVVQHHLGHPYFLKRQFEQALHYYQTSLDMESRQATARAVDS